MSELTEKLSDRTATSIKTGGFIHIILPTATPNVYESKKISVANLLSGIGDEPVRLDSKTGNVSQTISPNTLINKISIKSTAGAPTVKVGTSPNGSEIADTFDVGVSTNINVDLYTESDITIYFVILSGTVNIRFDLINNYHTL